MKKFLMNAFAVALAFTTALLLPSFKSDAAFTENGISISSDSITVIEDGVEAFTATIAMGGDASRLGCISSDESIATVAPVAVQDNVAAFAVAYVSTGSAVIGIYDTLNPAVIAYVPVTASVIAIEAPAKLGTNNDNYCSLVSYEFVPYGYTYENFNDYKCTLNLTYKCTAYGDTGFNKWGCYGYFYDADGNVLKKVHLYASSLAKDRVYHSEFNVPVNAVKFRIDGKS